MATSLNKNDFSFVFYDKSGSMASLNKNNMFMVNFNGVKFMVDGKIIDEVKTALNETISDEQHPSFLSIQKNSLTRSMKVDNIYDTLKTMTDEELEDFFKIEGKNEFELKTLYEIKLCFIEHQKKLSDKMIQNRSIESWSKICENILRFKQMILNEDYGLALFFKSAIMKAIQLLNMNGSAHSFLLLCELCPEFVCEDCYPVVNFCSSCFSDSIDHLGDFFVGLKSKHIEKWSKYFEQRN